MKAFGRLDIALAAGAGLCWAALMFSPDVAAAPLPMGGPPPIPGPPVGGAGAPVGGPPPAAPPVVPIPPLPAGAPIVGVPLPVPVLAAGPPSPLGGKGVLIDPPPVISPAPMVVPGPPPASPSWAESADRGTNVRQQGKPDQDLPGVGEASPVEAGTDVQAAPAA